MAARNRQYGVRVLTHRSVAAQQNDGLGLCPRIHPKYAELLCSRPGSVEDLRFAPGCLLVPPCNLEDGTVGGLGPEHRDGSSAPAARDLGTEEPALGAGVHHQPHEMLGAVAPQAARA